MKTICLYNLAGLILLTGLLPLSATEELTLRQCYERAVLESESERILQQEYLAAQDRYRAAIGSVLPEIGLFAEQSYRDSLRTNDAEDLIRSQGSVESVFRQRLSQEQIPAFNRRPFSSGIGFSWPVFTGFDSFNESRSRKHLARMMHYNRERQRELLFLDIAEVFYQILFYEEAEKLLKDEQRTLRARTGELARFVQLGRARNGELLQARAELLLVQTDIEKNSGLQKASRELMAFLINMPGSGFKLTDISELPDAGSLQSYLEKTGERKDILAQMQQVQSEEKQLYSAYGGHSPQVRLDGQYFFSQRPDTRRDWNITIRVDLPLFQGGTVHYESSARKRQLKASQLRLDRLRRSADHDVRTSYAVFISDLARSRLLEQAANLYRQSYYLQARDYRLGIVTNVEVLDALRRYHQTRRSQLESEMQARINHYRLHVAAGTTDAPLPESDDEGDGGEG